MRLKDNSKNNKILFKLELKEQDETSFEFSMLRKRSLDEVRKRTCLSVPVFGVLQWV